MFRTYECRLGSFNSFIFVYSVLAFNCTYHVYQQYIYIIIINIIIHRNAVKQNQGNKERER